MKMAKTDKKSKEEVFAFFQFWQDLSKIKHLFLKFETTFSIFFGKMFI